MKKIIFFLFFITTLSFSLEISSIDPLNFGTVVLGDRSVTLNDVGVYVEGKAGRKVEIILPEDYNLEGNPVIVKVRNKVLVLDGNGRGEFRLNVKLMLKKINIDQKLNDKLSIKVRYVD